MRILIVGAGALGGYFGGCLQRAGRDVTFLVRPARAAQLARDGLRISSPHGDFSVAVRTIDSASIRESFDLVLLAVKSYSLTAAMNDLDPAIGPASAILPVINGMAHIEALSARFGANRILGGVAIISATLGQDGRIIQLLPVHELVFGDPEDDASDRGHAIADVLMGAGFDARQSEIIMQEMWEKWVALATNAGVTCLMRAAIGDIVAAPSGPETILQLFDECCAVAGAYRFALRPPSIARWRAALTTPGSTLKASMLRDIENGSQTEGEHVLGDMVRRARQSGIATPILDLARTHVAAYEARRAREAINP